MKNGTDEARRKCCEKLHRTHGRLPQDSQQIEMRFPAKEFQVFADGVFDFGIARE